MKRLKWFFVEIKKIYDFFGHILSFCFIVIFITIIIMGISLLIPPRCPSQELVLPQLSGSGTYIPPPPPPWYQNIDIGTIVSGTTVMVFVIAFVVSLLYFIIGIIRHFLIHSKKKKNKSVKVMILRGIIGMILILLLVITLYFEFSLIPLCL